MDKIGGRLGPEYTLDKEWVEATEKRGAQARARDTRHALTQTLARCFPLARARHTRRLTTHHARAQKLDRLEADLNTAKSSLVKARPIHPHTQTHAQP